MRDSVDERAARLRLTETDRGIGTREASFDKKQGRR